MPRAEGFEVTVTRLDASPDEVRFLRALLCAAEKQRAERFRFERDRRRFVVARARLRQLLAARIGIKPEDVELAYGKNGKPCLKHNGGHFSVSHCDDVALFAFSKAAEIGVDVEAVRPIRDADAMAAQLFSPRENRAYAALAPADRPLAFLRCWTRMEAVAKALGDGLSNSLKSHAPGWRVHSFFPLPGFIAAVASHHG
jgi:4'-phosphopantetheinyl transferase